MKKTAFLLSAAVVWLGAIPAAAQTALNVNPSRSIGQITFEQTPRTQNPNLVEGREFYFPWYVAVDRSSTPAALYVSDPFNNRVLGWRNANGFANGSFADIVIGQPDRLTTTPGGPSTSRVTGFSLPGALAVDDKGNLYVVDSNNNRILRFPKPFSQADDLKVPDMVIGQPNFNTNPANNGGVSEKSIATSGSGTIANTGLVFDSSGNLFFSDAFNNRVLRYPASALNSGQNFPSADLVLGQASFSTNGAPDSSQRTTNRSGLRTPSGIAIDQQGRLYVCDGLSRVLVFTPPFLIGQAATRLMGIGQVLPGNAVSPTVSEYTLSNPEGVFIFNNNPMVVDTLNHRILRYDPYDQWPAETPAVAGSTITLSPPAKAVIGQIDFTQNKPNKGQPEPNESSLNQPLSGTVINNDIIVADAANHRVLTFSQGNLGAIGAAASRVLGQAGFNFNSPNLIEGREFFFAAGFSAGPNIGGDLSDGAGIVIDNASNPPRLYIADTFNNRVLGFRDARTAKSGDKADLVIGQPDFQRSLINYPSNDADKMSDQGLFHPSGLAVDASGNLWIADSGNGRVLRYASPFTQTGSQRPNLVLGQAGFSGQKLQQATATNMSFPYGIAFIADGSVLVSDSVNNRVVLFRKPAGGDFTNGMRAEKAFGQFDLLTGFRGTGDKRFNNPRGIAVDTDDRLYVMDAGNSRLAIYDRVGNAGVDPAPALSLGGFSTPQNVYVSPQTGEIWVADTRNNRVLRFPRFDRLTFSAAADYGLNSAAPLAVTQDAFGNVFVVEAINRVTMFYNALSAKNSASYNDQRPISPGMITSLFTLAPGAVKFSDSLATTPGLPLPTTLNDTQVLVNGTPAPLYFVSPNQVNFVVPYGIKDASSAEVQVVRASTGQLVATYSFSVSNVSPALYTTNASGSGALVALNEDNTVNSAANRIAKGKVITLFGTGAGFVSGAPPDGVAADGPVPTDLKPRIAIQNDFVADADILYSGLAPGYPGLWQINFKVPDFVVPGDQIPVGIILQSVQSTIGEGGKRLSTFISVKQQ